MDITPTVGRVVWFFVHPEHHYAFKKAEPGKPLAAIIASVVDDNLLNLTVFDAVGVPWSMINVPLLQDGALFPSKGAYATWMPYQLGQAKKEVDGAQAKPKASDLPPHQQRVIDEERDLSERLSKLEVFVQTDKYVTLSTIDQQLLSRQLAAMTIYCDILRARITRFI